jgi:hypothetical protein
MQTGTRLPRGQSQTRTTEHNGSDVLVSDSSKHTCWVFFACKGQKLKLHLFGGEVIFNLFEITSLDRISRKVYMTL